MSATASPDYPLIDGAPDDIIEERAWVPVAHAATPPQAEAWLRRIASDAVSYLADDGQTIRATGERAWMCEAPCSTCEGSGADEYGYQGDIPMQPFPACETCGGDGEQHDDEYIRWEDCRPDTEGAAEFWKIEVVDATS